MATHHAPQLPAPDVAAAKAYGAHDRPPPARPGRVSALCLLAAGVTTRIAATAFTLAWLHTIEHTRWEEDWRIEADRLVLVEARIEGSGAGMEPPPEAHLENGRLVWQPNQGFPELGLRRAPQAGDWQLCLTDGCRHLADRMGSDADPVTLRPCH